MSIIAINKVEFKEIVHFSYKVKLNSFRKNCKMWRKLKWCKIFNHIITKIAFLKLKSRSSQYKLFYLKILKPIITQIPLLNIQTNSLNLFLLFLSLIKTLSKSITLNQTFLIWLEISIKFWQFLLKKMNY